MPDVSFNSLAVVLGVSFLATLILGLAPRLRVPTVALEITLGIIVGPSLLGWAKADEPVTILSTLGLGFLLFLSGLELDLEALRGEVLAIAAAAFAFTLVLAVVAGYVLSDVGLVRDPLLAAVILTATSLGLVFPVLEESGQLGSRFGELVSASASMGEFGSVILLSLFFSRNSTDAGTRLFLLGAFFAAVALAAFALTRRSKSMRISKALLRLQDATGQIRVRGALFILGLFIVLATQLGLEAILGAFVAGALVRLIDRDAQATHPEFHLKLEAVGYGFLIPVFFVTSGITFDLNALTGQPATLARVPIFLGALLIVRGLPAVIGYPRVIGTRRSVAAGLLQATSLPVIVAATQIGVATNAITTANAAAFLAAGLLSALLFPVLALGLLRGATTGDPARGTDGRDRADQVRA